MKNANQTQGMKVANPFKNDTEVKNGLTKMFGSNVAEQLTSKDVYKYTRTAEHDKMFENCLTRNDYFKLRDKGFSYEEITAMGVEKARTLANEVK